MHRKEHTPLSGQLSKFLYTKSTSCDLASDQETEHCQHPEDPLCPFQSLPLARVTTILTSGSIDLFCLF